MSQTLEEIVARVEDPDTPVVWLDPRTPERFWQELPDALAQRGFRVSALDEVVDRESLMRGLALAVSAPAIPGGDLVGMKDCLLSVAEGGGGGWALIFRYPGALRQNDEAGFEDFLEVIEMVHEIQMEQAGNPFKIVLQD